MIRIQASSVNKIIDDKRASPLIDIAQNLRLCNLGIFQVLENALLNERDIYTPLWKEIATSFPNVKYSKERSYKENIDDNISIEEINEFVKSRNLTPNSTLLTDNSDYDYKSYNIPEMDNDCQPNIDDIGKGAGFKKQFPDSTLVLSNRIIRRFSDTTDSRITRYKRYYKLDAITYEIFGKPTGMINNKNGEQEYVFLLKFRNNIIEPIDEDLDCLATYCVLNKLDGVLILHNDTKIATHRPLLYKQAKSRWEPIKKKLDIYASKIYRMATNPYSIESLEFIKSIKSLSSF